ncbi:MAG: hypothetical protein ABI686_08845 [Acidobacteriota bacterium]
MRTPGILADTPDVVIEPPALGRGPVSVIVVITGLNPRTVTVDLMPVARPL